MFERWSNPLYWTVDVHHDGVALTVVERHCLTGRYRTRRVDPEATD